MENRQSKIQVYLFSDVLKPQHQYLIEIIRVLRGQGGEVTLGGLRKLLSVRLNAKKDYYTLKSACELLETLGFVHIIKRQRFTFIGLSEEGKRKAKDLIDM